MSNHNNGRSFEKLVAVINEAYKDSSQTKIYTNYRIKDKFNKGKSREFDIFIITKVNNTIFKIAIECKDYKRPVTIEKIEAFNSKCSTVAGINKKMIVSPVGFQSGAIENAEQFDIELYTLENINRGVFSNWTDPNNIRWLTMQTTLLDYSVWINDSIFGAIEIEKKAIDHLLCMSSSTDTTPLTPYAFIEYAQKRGTVGEIALALQKEASKLGIKHFESPFSLEDIFYLTPLDGFEMFIDFSNKRIPVVSIKAKFRFSIIHVETSDDVQIRSYSDIKKNQNGELVSATFKGGHALNFYKATGEKYEKVVLTESEKVTPMYCGLKYNIKTGKVILIDQHPSLKKKD